MKIETTKEQFQATRNDFIDFMRGVFIINMMIVHYGNYLSIFQGKIVSKIISYTDCAIEGFIFLAGLSIGRYYYKQFLIKPKKIIKRLLTRVEYIIIIQYIMIVTISIPFILILGKKITGSDTFINYIIKSFLFINQIGLLHILPTFIPLFLLAIPILFLFEKKLDVIVLFSSLIFLAVGNDNPYIFNIGDKTIFPVILWQIYFVAGTFAGKELAHRQYHYETKTVVAHLGISLCVFGMMSLLHFGHHFIPFIETVKSNHMIVFSKFPLNIFGLLYRSSLLYIIFSGCFAMWHYIEKSPFSQKTVVLLGKYSLFTFVIHVYSVKLLYLLDNLYDLNSFLNYLIVLFTLMIIFISLWIHDKKIAMAELL